MLVTYTENDLVKRHRGTMPVILTCPHDGTETPANVDERTRRDTPSDCLFEADRDTQASVITEGVAQKILEVTGLSPYVVIARFHRKFIDVNREPRCAFIDADAQLFYAEYHSRIAESVNELLSQNETRGFLFDIHGTRRIASDPADIYLGTGNGSTLLPGFDRSRIFMQHGLHGLLKSSAHPTGSGGSGPIFSYGVSPENETKAETSEVSGGFTVKKYGAVINSIQIELANTIRSNAEKRAFIIEDLAFAIVNFARRYSPF